MRRAIGFLGAAALAAGVALFGAGVASADPSSNDWMQLRLCESSNNYAANTGNGYYGAYQFDLPTWKSVGGSGRPDQASRAEQDLRALTLYRMRGWSPWICAALVGLQQDSDGGSGVLPGNGGGGSTPAPTPTPTPTPTPAPAPTGGIPRFPGAIAAGAFNESLKAFQLRLSALGYGTYEGTGWMGSKTIAGIKTLQRRTGRPQTGVLDAVIWAKAWNNAYRAVGSVPKYPGALAFGNYNAAYIPFQKRLDVMGYGALEGTGWYGDKTRAAVQKLQIKLRKAPNGVVSADVWAAAWNAKYKATAAAPTAPAKYVPATDASCRISSTTPQPWGGVVMVKGQTYRDLQCFQRALGVDFGLTGTGFFGDGTYSAVLKMQALVGLPLSGKVDQATWNAAWTRF